MAGMERVALAGFLRARREALSPEDVGMPRGPRRRTAGLRREEVAVLAQMSTDYYSRLEQARGPQPSLSMLASITRALRLGLDERDYLYRIAGQAPPARALRTDHVSPGLMRVIDRLQDTPAELINVLTETLLQTPPAIGLLGDRSALTGLHASTVYRWFTDPAARALYPEEDHGYLSLAFVSDLRRASSLLPGDPRVAQTVRVLTDESQEFVKLWETHEVRLHLEHKRIVHPDLGVISVQCQHLHDPGTHQALLVFTATPGTEDAEKLRFLAVTAREAVG